MSKQSNLTIEEAFELFIRKCKVKNLTDLSIESYKKKIVHFYEFTDKTQLVSTINADMVDEYVLWLRENTQANDITINSYLRSLRAFLYYCMNCKYIPSFKVTLIKADQKVKETYTDDDLEKLLVKPDVNKCTFSTYKTWVFENYLLATGNRISSALNVRIEDVNFEDGLITLRKTKNRKQQIIPLSNALSNILKEYLEFRGGEPEDYLFCNEYGAKAMERTYQQLVRRYNIKRNVNCTSCHAFRHTYARLAVMNGVDAFTLMRLLGHSNITVTQQYVNMFSKDLQSNFDRISPLDNLLKPKNTIRM